MASTGKSFDRGAWAVGGETFIGLGAGFFIIQTSIFAFIASMLIGIGRGITHRCTATKPVRNT